MFMRSTAAWPAAWPAASPAASPARRRVLFVGGSLDQTTIVHKIASELAEAECVFTPYYADGLLHWAAERGLLDFTTLGGRPKAASEAFLRERGATLDPRGSSGGFDLVVTTSDLVVPRNLHGVPIVLVQEGMTDPEDWRYGLVRRLKLPRYLASTSMTGLSHAYAAFCVASEGYRELFARKGVAPDKLEVTGIPNFDDCESFLSNDFPLHGYVLATTSCLRETLRPEDRRGFIRSALEVADGRTLFFKLHPNEDHVRARREIEALACHSIVFDSGNTNHMIANCDALVTRYSSAVYVAVALGKEVHADIEPVTLRRLAPIQNGGTSARRIANVCRRFLS